MTKKVRGQNPSSMDIEEWLAERAKQALADGDEEMHMRLSGLHSKLSAYKVHLGQYNKIISATTESFRDAVYGLSRDCEKLKQQLTRRTKALNKAREEIRELRALLYADPPAEDSCTDADAASLYVP